MAKSNYKGKKRRNIRKDRVECEDIQKEDRRDNDVSWYAYSPQLVIDAASLAYSNPLGARYNYYDAVSSGHDFAGTAEGLKNETLPGIIALETAPTVGISVDNSSAINLAARNLYTYVRHANSGHSNYDSPDLMMYVLAMDSAYSIYAFMTRAYGILSTYSQFNRYLPQGLFTAMNLDFDDFQTHMADFRYYINQYAVKLSAYCIPGNMSYILRHIWLYSNVYKDADILKSQLYVYTPSHVYRFAEGAETSETVNHLEPVFLGRRGVSSAKALTFSELMAIADMQIRSIVVSESMNIMSGDILKAFGQGAIMQIAPIPADYNIVPVYSVEVLQQIHNATVLPFGTGTASEDFENFRITQNTELTDVNSGALLFNPTFKHSTSYGNGFRLFDIAADFPDPGITMVGSRLTVGTTESFADSTYSIKLDSCGSDICVGMYVIRNEWNNSTDTLEIKVSDNYTYSYQGLVYPTSGVVQTAQVTERLFDLTKFDFHPQVVLFLTPSTSDVPPVYAGTLGDVFNSTMVSNFELRKMHETALLSQLHVPTYGSYALGNS